MCTAVSSAWDALAARHCDRCGGPLLFAIIDASPSDWAFCPPCGGKTVRAERASCALRAEFIAHGLEAAADELPAAQRKAARALHSGAHQLRALERDLIKLAAGEPGRLTTPIRWARDAAGKEPAASSGEVDRPTRRQPFDRTGYWVAWTLTGVPGDPFAYARSLVRAAIRIEQPLRTGAERTGEVDLSIMVEAGDSVSALEAGSRVMLELVRCAGGAAPVLLDARIHPHFESE